MPPDQGIALRQLLLSMRAGGTGAWPELSQSAAQPLPGVTNGGYVMVDSACGGTDGTPNTCDTNSAASTLFSGNATLQAPHWYTVGTCKRTNNPTMVARSKFGTRSDTGGTSGAWNQRPSPFCASRLMVLLSTAPAIEGYAAKIT